MNELAPNQRTENGDPVDLLRRLISEGRYGSEGRLPPERHLTEELGVSRGTLRKALDVLEREGLIWRHVGKGTFVADSAQHHSSSDAVRLGRQLTPYRMMRARLVIEPAIVREAAVNATGETLARLRQTQERCRAATTWAIANPSVTPARPPSSDRAKAVSKN